MDREWFELRRQSDDLIYTFRRRPHDGGVGYQRQDRDLWITFRQDLVGSRGMKRASRA